MSIKDIKPKAINLKKAFIFILLASFSLSLMATLVKIAILSVNNSIIIFSRFSISFIYILLVFLIKKIRKKSVPIKTNHLSLHIIRAITSMLAMFLFYYSLKYISLVECNLLLMTNVLFIPIIAIIFFKVKIPIKHWISILIGFLGIILILKPGFEIFQPKALYALLSGFIASISFIYIRKISKLDHHHTSMFYYFSFAFFASSVLVLFNFQSIDFKILLLLIGIGISGTLYQEFFIRATVYASVKFNSSLLYSSIIFSAFFGFIFFKNIPDLITFLGMSLIVIGGILTIQSSKKDII
ncbi:MAG: Riboflavin transporter [Candidatus Anoxychlamydiales bacterium]|nr:Riboflavin transporter [Candidatus Anoxychlamydiales bacterium]